MSKSQSYKLIPFTLLFITLGLLIMVIPPTNIYVIVACIILVALICLYAISFVSSKRHDYILAAVFGASFLTINWLAGFDALNTILLISFIIGLKFLLK